MSIFKRQDPTKLQEQVAALKGSSGYQKDEKEWRLTTDTNKNGSAVIRFLPARSDDELAFVKLVSHSFKKNNKWYINNCSSTHGDYDGCPVCQYISENNLYEKAQANKGGEADKLNSLLARKTHYWANILVVRDPAKPENNGKVFKFRFGKSIMDKITTKLQGDADLGIAGVNVTCPFSGMNLTLKCKDKGGWANYDDSAFESVSEIAGINDEAVQKAIFEGMSDLRPITAPDQFKPKADLLKLFNGVMGGALLAGSAASASADLDKDLQDFDADLKTFDQTSDVKTSGGVSSLNVGGSSVPDDDVPFDTGSGSGDEDLDALLNF